MSSLQLDALAQVVVREGDDRRVRTFTLTGQTCVEHSWFRLKLATKTGAGNPTKLGAEVFGTGTGQKLIYVESNQIVQVHWTTAIAKQAATSIRMNANGVLMMMVTNRTSFGIYNPSGTNTAYVQVAIVSKTAV